MAERVEDVCYIWYLTTLKAQKVAQAVLQYKSCDPADFFQH